MHSEFIAVLNWLSTFVISLLTQTILGYFLVLLLVLLTLEFILNFLLRR